MLKAASCFIGSSSKVDNLQEVSDIRPSLLRSEPLLPWCRLGYTRHGAVAAALVLAAMLLLALFSSHAQAQGEATIDLPFSRFFNQPIGPGGLQLSEALKAADGQQVRLRGYMVSTERPTPGSLLLSPVPIRMSEHADGEADDLPPSTVVVLMAAGHTQRRAVHRPGLIALTGRLSVGRAEDSQGHVSWVRLQLPREALAPLATLPSAHHHHPIP